MSVPGYTLVRRLDDSGGQATVHLGRSLDPPHHEAAIKIYHAALRSSRDRQRFQREVEAMQRLAADPHIIDVYDIGVLESGQAYLAMRLCPGGSLATMLSERGPMSPAAVISLGETMAEALGRAHRLGVLHRDVKPHNILLGDGGAPVLADFGIVALSHEAAATTARWTASYAAPELFRGEPATERTDIYGLAATLYTMLAGRPPHHDRFRNPSPAELLWRRDSRPARVDQVPEKLMNVLLQALSPAPEERFATAHAFAAALREAMPAPPPAPVNGSPRPSFEGVDSRRRASLVPSVQPGFLAAAATGIGLVALWSASLAPIGLTLWWTALTVLIGVCAGLSRLVLGWVAFGCGMAVALSIAVSGYDASPVASLGWILTAFAVGVLAWVWGKTTAALRLRWFALRHRVRRHRWFGQASARPEFRELESLPGARFVRLAEGTCHFAVTCGRSVALVRWASWPDGDYVPCDEAVRRNGAVWPQGGTELARARRGLAQLDIAVRRRVFLVVDTPGALRGRDLNGDLTICHARELARGMGHWLSEQPYDVDLELLARLMPLAEGSN